MKIGSKFVPVCIYKCLLCDVKVVSSNGSSDWAAAAFRSAEPASPAGVSNRLLAMSGGRLLHPRGPAHLFACAYEVEVGCDVVSLQLFSALRARLSRE